MAASLKETAEQAGSVTTSTEELAATINELAASIELEQVPDHSTLQKAAKRLLCGEFRGKLFEMTVRLGKLETAWP